MIDEMFNMMHKEKKLLSHSTPPTLPYTFIRKMLSQKRKIENWFQAKDFFFFRLFIEMCFYAYIEVYFCYFIVKTKHKQSIKFFRNNDFLNRNLDEIMEKCVTVRNFAARVR